MIKAFDFYFDFVSPYSFLAHKEIKKIEKQNAIKIRYKPILLGGLHKLGEITAPAFNERKMKNMRNDCELISKKNNIQFKWNDKFPINSLHLMRGYISIDSKFKDQYIDTCFNAYWKNNIDISLDQNINDILNNCKINEKEFFNLINDQKIKTELKNLTVKAFEKDIFGAPTFVVNEKIFWGQDRLEYALDECNF